MTHDFAIDGKDFKAEVEQNQALGGLDTTKYLRYRWTLYKVAGEKTTFVKADYAFSVKGCYKAAELYARKQLRKEAKAERKAKKKGLLS